MFWSITSLISLGTFENFVKLQEITMNLLNKVIIITSGDNEKFHEITMNLLNKSLSSLVVMINTFIVLYFETIIK